MPRLFFDISDRHALGFYCLASCYPQGKAAAEAALRGQLPAEQSAGNGNPAESHTMEYQSSSNTLQSDGTISTTVIDWDEFRKYAKIGDTIREPSRTLKIYDKVY
ncbi:hypothetical protein [Pseudomonas synxantha]|nr:hypothetical protein [Pseudomonas synxantha]